MKSMNTENPRYSLSLLCETLEVSRSGCSQWAAGKADAREKADETLKQKVRESFDASRQSYGYRRVHADLQAAGNRVTQQRVARLMREEHLQGRRKRRYNPHTTQSDHDAPIAPNRLQHAAKPDGCDQACLKGTGGACPSHLRSIHPPTTMKMAHRVLTPKRALT